MLPVPEILVANSLISVASRPCQLLLDKTSQCALDLASGLQEAAGQWLYLHCGRDGGSRTVTKALCQIHRAIY